MKTFILTFLFLSATFILNAQQFEWAKSYEGYLSSDCVNSISIDASGNIYTTGSFEDTMDGDPGLGIFNLVSNGNRDIFIQKLDSSGNFLWAKSIGDSNQDRAYSITTDFTGNVYIAGYYNGVVDFDPGIGIYNLSSNGDYDSFILKISQNNIVSLTNQTHNSLIAVFPNPSSDFVTISLNNKSKGQVIVLDLLGKVVLNKEFNSNQIQLSLKSIESKGTYLVKIMDSNGNVIANKKLIYQ